MPPNCECTCDEPEPPKLTTPCDCCTCTRPCYIKKKICRMPDKPKSFRPGMKYKPPTTPMSEDTTSRMSWKKFTAKEARDARVSTMRALVTPCNNEAKMSDLTTFRMSYKDPRICMEVVELCQADPCGCPPTEKAPGATCCCTDEGSPTDCCTVELAQPPTTDCACTKPKKPPPDNCCCPPPEVVPKPEKPKCYVLEVDKPEPPEVIDECCTCKPKQKRTRKC